jgi:hypothetical protein
LERRLQMILADLEAQGGGGLLLVSKASHIEPEEQIIERFRAERKQDYDEFLDRCIQFIEELKKETTAQKFTFAELEENEEDLHKLMQWLRKIYHRDFFGGTKRDEATNALAGCRRALKDYAAQVYLHLGYDPPEVLLIDEEGQEET